MNFFTNWFKQPPKEKSIPEQPFIREQKFKFIDPVDARINEALDKLIPKIREKHFSPEIQGSLKKMQGLIDKIYFKVDLENYVEPEYYTVKNLMIVDRYGLTIDIDDITIPHYYYSIYNFNTHSHVRDYLIQEIRFMGAKPPYKLLVEDLYDYFFNGKLEKDIEEQTKSNREYEARKEKEKLEAADRLCKLINTKKV